MAALINETHLTMAREIVESNFTIRQFFFDAKQKSWDDADLTEKREALIAYARYIRMVAQTLANPVADRALPTNQ